MIAVSYHADLKEVQSDAGLSALLGAGAQAAPFDRLDWWCALEAHCGLDPLLAVAREGDDLAVLPLHSDGGQLSALANWYSFRVRPVVSQGADAPRLLTALAADLSNKAPRLSLQGLPEEEDCARSVAAAFRAAGWVVQSSMCDTNHILRLNGRSYEEFLASRPGPLRTTLKRKSGKVDVKVLTRFDAGIWADYESIYAESWKPAEGSPAFLRHFAEAEGEAGRLRLGIARADGEALAAQMWTVEGGTAFIHKLAHRESARALSPGTVLSAALFRHVIDCDQVSLIDFGTGDNPYKRDWMEEVRTRYQLDMYRPGHPGNWAQLARLGLKRLAAGGSRG